MNTDLDLPSPATRRPAVDSVPAGTSTVTPHLICAGAAAAVEFYKKAFGATELMRLPGQDGRLMHACLQLGDSRVMLMDEFPEWGAKSPKTFSGSPVTIHLAVEDADALFARAVEAGATAVMPVEEMFWGDRYGVVDDPFGHRWSVSTHVRDVSPEEMGRAATQSCGCPEGE